MYKSRIHLKPFKLLQTDPVFVPGQCQILSCWFVQNQWFATFCKPSVLDAPMYQFQDPMFPH